MARAFIVQERPKDDPKPTPLRAVPDPGEMPASLEADPAEGHPANERPGEGRSGAAAAKRPAKPATQKRAEPPRLLATLLVPVTVRLRPEIASALKRASLERQLNGVATYTQQDIVEEALLPWLQAEGLID